jgi:hypothetical protein
MLTNGSFPNLQIIVTGDFDGDTDNPVPSEYILSQNYPTPFNPGTRIKYTLPSESNVKISVFNILGEKVTELINARMAAGRHTIDFNAGDLSAGIYIPDRSQSVIG